LEGRRIGLRKKGGAHTVLDRLQIQVLTNADGQAVWTVSNLRGGSGGDGLGGSGDNDLLPSGADAKTCIFPRWRRYDFCAGVFPGTDTILDWKYGRDQIELEDLAAVGSNPPAATSRSFFVQLRPALMLTPSLRSA
jgi:hypothetical protein